MRTGLRQTGRTGKALPALLLSLAVITGPARAQEAEPEAEEPVPAPDVDEPGVNCTVNVVSSHRSRLDIERQMSSETERLYPSRTLGRLSSSHTAAASGIVAGDSGGSPVQYYRNYIDAEIFGKMRADGVTPAALSGDAEFLRRVSLDLTGVIPDAAATRAFLADPKPDKRDRIIDKLLHSDAFVDRWTMWFGDLVANVKSTSAMGNENYPGRNAFYAYIRDSIRSEKPYDQLVREVISGAGDTFVEGPPNYWVRSMQGNGPIQDTYDNLFAASAEHFLGIQAECTSCHNGGGHTDLINVGLSTRTRMNFWQSAAFFSQTTATAATDTATNSRKYTLSNNTTGTYRLNTTSGNKVARQPAPGQPNTVAPAFYLTGEKPQTGKPLRVELARMLTAHPQFARAAANRLWKEMFGLGIVDPVDTFDLLRQDASTVPPGWAVQPTHPALLNRLQDDFRASNYSLRALLRTMAASTAYQLSARYTTGTWNEAMTPYFARHLSKRLGAEQLLDSIFMATNVAGSVTVTGIPNVTRSMTLPDTLEGGGWSNFLNTFLRGNRDASQRSLDLSTVQALTLLNDSTILTRIKNGTANTTVQKTLKATQNPPDIADTLFLATLCRPPSPSEKATAVAFLKTPVTGQNAANSLIRQTEDLQYALLNRLEFLFN